MKYLKLYETLKLQDDQTTKTKNKIIKYNEQSFTIAYLT